MIKKELEIIINKLLSLMGFEKKKSTWFRNVGGVLQVMDLQKSNYGDHFFLNICFIPAGMDIEGLPHPKENKCPIRIRAAAAFPDIKEQIDIVLDLSSDMSDEDRSQQIDSFCTERLLPFYDLMKDNISLRQAIEVGRFDKGAVNLASKRFLGM